MSFNIIVTEVFERKLKRLAKKHKSIKADLLAVIEQLSENPIMGTPIGKDCYKIRVAITSKGKGRSGGARMITYIRITSEIVYLIDIYDKSEQSTISDKELQSYIDMLADTIE